MKSVVLRRDIVAPSVISEYHGRKKFGLKTEELARSEIVTPMDLRTTKDFLMGSDL